MKSRALMLSFFLLAASTLPAALNFSFVADHTNSIYRCGELATIRVTAWETNRLMATSGKLKVRLDASQPNAPMDEMEIDLAQANPFTVTGSLRRPGFLWVRLSGDAVKGTVRTAQSFGFEPERICRGAKRPADFDSWWDAQVAKLEREVPLDPQVTPYPEHAADGCELFKVSFASFGRRVWGYLSVPKDQSQAPFPVRVRVPGAGMGGWSNRLGGATDREIVLFVAVYPWEPDWDNWAKECAPKLKAQNAELSRRYELDGGGCYQAGISESRESYYYYSAILGINRAVNWVAKRRDVDRRCFTYNGHSQGGGIGLALLALNRHFTRGVILEPALTDLLGCDAGRVSGWPSLIEHQSSSRTAVARRWAPYFDGACFADRIRVPVRMVVGFSDTTCPPTAVYSAFNALKSEDKCMTIGIDSTHHPAAAVTDPLNEWEKEVCVPIAGAGHASTRVQR